MIPTFADIWPLTTKTGYKERMAKKFNSMSDVRKVAIGEQIKTLKIKPRPEEIIK